MTETHYDVLGLDPETAELNDIKKAFKKLALQYHPDRVAPEMKEEAAEKFRAVRESFERLSNGPSKLRYDTELGVKKKKGKKSEHPPSHNSERAPKLATKRRYNHNVATEDGNYFNKNAVGGDVESPDSGNRECLANFAKVGVIVLVILCFTCLFLFV